MTDTANIQLKSVQNGAKTLNDKLSAKGYFCSKPEKLQKLLFATTDKDQLLADGTEARAYENDKNVINIVYSLLESQDVSAVYKTTILRKLADKDAQIEALQSQLAKQEKLLALKDRKIAQLEQDKLKQQEQVASMHMRTSNLSAKNREWERNFQMYSSDVDRELRRNEVEIDRLSSRLSRKRPAFTPLSSEEKRPRSNGTELGSLMEENEQLRKQLGVDLRFSYNVYDFLRQWHESRLDLRMGPESSLLPPTFIPTADQLSDFNASKYSVHEQNEMFLKLLQQIEVERDNDTFRFKKVHGKENQAVTEKLIVE